MVRLTLLDNTDIVVNADLIEFVEKTPDTVISLTTGKKIVVRESVDQVIDSVVHYKHDIVSGDYRLNKPAAGGRLSIVSEGL